MLRIGEPSAQSNLRFGARSAIAFDFNTENETALPFETGAILNPPIPR